MYTNINNMYKMKKCVYIISNVVIRNYPDTAIKTAIKCLAYDPVFQFPLNSSGIIYLSIIVPVPILEPKPFKLLF